MVRSHLEFAHSVWNPYKLGLIHDIEKVQMRATKLVRECKKLSYDQRLRYLKLSTLRYRRLRGDMIEVYKILHGFYNDYLVPCLHRNIENKTRDNSLN